MAPPLLVAVFLTLVLPARSSPQLGYGALDRRLPLAAAAPAADGLASDDLAPRGMPGFKMSAAMGTLPVISARARDVADGRRRRRRRQRNTEEEEGGKGGETGRDKASPLSSSDGDNGNNKLRRAGHASAGPVSLPVLHGAAPRLRKRDERQGLLSSPLTTRSDVAYYTELEIGNPPQRVRVQLDTGSFELWVNADCGNLTAPGDVSFCRDSQRYEPGQSETARRIEQQRSLRYGIGTANISYVRDDIALPGSRDVMNQVRFGVADASEDQFSGILGIGFGRDIAVNYNTFLDELARQGLTRTKAFSVALGAKDTARGAITFGGLDSSQFAGRLAPLPIIPAAQSPDRVPRYWVSLRSIAHTGPGRPASADPLPGSALPVFLDTGATLTLLPAAVVRAMATALGAAVDDPAALFQKTFYRLPCGLMDQEGSFDFGFDGVTIFVPYKEMIRQLAQPGQDPVCYLGLMQSDKFSLLGDTFLRSAYVVFDLDRNMTYMARHANCGSTPEAISPMSNVGAMTGRCNEPSLAKTRLDASEAVAAGAAATNSTGRKKSAAASGLVLDTASLVTVVGAAACALVFGLV
ncbi:eukaryotic aspartyl protease [Hirsutella rhossiliensis]|uniref:Eukaryotic aspartyl protease domain-containing protein n=1 Tax=Hirsutella rhossiliensis TaxID=111463 RepID=A0A9P8MUI7_9HYPO|nr:eukaryotic aspartyl protease domain-containing protein [Hirsutella rhossiliensis]KAH0961404.1 eukaryotic aspartyl protease domain-containing protein [Hirsutella rhossiliensis]